jgi:hypothetical protein
VDQVNGRREGSLRAPRIGAIVTLHGAILIGCSLIGTVGYGLEHGRLQITSGIPAAVGLGLISVLRSHLGTERGRTWLLFAMTLAFGVVVTHLSIRFVPQDFQPLRKRIYFPVMALSSIATGAIMARHLCRTARSGGAEEAD